MATERNNWYLTSYGYDSAGRVISVTEAEQAAAGGSTENLLSYTKSYAYDPNDNRTGFTLTRNNTVIQDVDYTYDNLNRLSTVSEDGTVQAAYTYDTNGNRASLTYANGVVESYTYNKANWVTGVTNKLGDTVLSSYTYTYYATGNQYRKTDHTGKVTTYVYDGLGRLEHESDTTGLNINYNYDASHNRSSMIYRDNSESYELYYYYDANNQLTEERKRQDGKYTTVATYTYDGNGNQLTKTGAEGTATYTYNGFNQQTGFAFGTVTASYAYNAAGIRTSKAVNGVQTSYLLDGGDVVAETQNNAITASYLRGANLISRESDNSTSYYLYNAHGDVVNLTSSTGTVTKTYAYDAFGVEQNPDATDVNPFRYCGEYYDAETGQYYLRARYYDPTDGRFTQPDSHWNSTNRIYGDNPQKINEREDVLGITRYSYRPQITAIMQSGNLYVYCTNNPVSYYDRSGYFICAITGTVTGALGGALTAVFKGDDPGRAAIAGAIGGALSGLFTDIGLAFAGGSGGVGTAMGIGIAAAGAMISSVVQSVTEQILNGTDINHLDMRSALISGGISAGFSLVSMGLGTIVNNVYGWNNVGKNLLEKLVNTLRHAGVEDSAVATYLSLVFVELDKATAEAIVNNTK